MSEPESGVPPNVGEIAGPQLIGHLCNWGLFGVLVVQVYLYYIAFPGDRRYLKMLVAFVFVLEVVQTILATHDVFGALASGWGTPDALDHDYFSPIDVPIMSPILSCAVQLFNAWRIYNFSKSRVVTIAVVVLGLVELIASLVFAAEYIRIKRPSLIPTHAIKPCALWLSSSAACDVIIAGAWSYYLWGKRSKSEMPRTKSLLSRLIYLMIGGGTVTATVAIFNVIVFFAAKSTDIFITLVVILSKLYTNSLLVQLNFRMRIIGSRDDRGRDYVIELREAVPLDKSNSDPVGRIKPVASHSSSDGHFPGQSSAPNQFNEFQRSKGDAGFNVQVLVTKEESTV